MYEDKRGNIFSISGAFFKVLMVILIVIAFFIVFYAIKKVSYEKPTNVTDFAVYSTNLKDMKTGAFEYFTADKLPAKVGESKTLTLRQMIDQKIVLDFTNVDKSCSLEKSYVKATKTSDENYALKVLLQCGKYEDFLVTTIEKKTDCTTDCKEIIKEVIKEQEKVAVKPPTSTDKKTEVVKIVKKEYRTTINIPCVGCEDKPTPPPAKTMWYKHKKVSYELHYNYCQNTESTYRTVSWIPANTTSGKVFTYDLKLKNSLPFMNNSVSLKSHSYFATTTIDYQTYIDERDIDLYQVGNNQNNNAYITSATLLRNASLKKSNFTYAVGNPYKKSDGYYYVTISYTYKNKIGVIPYYFPTVGYDILFTPIKFTVTAAQDNKCTKDASSNSHKYTNHTKINPIYDYVVTYVWTKNIFEPNLIYTGISEAR